MISYALYEIQGTDLVVSEMNYQDGDTYQTLLNFIAAHSSMVERFILKDYSNFYQEHFSLEPGEMNVHVEPYMMGRIVNCKHFIAKYPFENELGTILTKVEDDVLQSNNGVWKISKAGIKRLPEENWQIKGKLVICQPFSLDNCL